jgi:hypothetical protein
MPASHTRKHSGAPLSRVFWCAGRQAGMLRAKQQQQQHRARKPSLHKHVPLACMQHMCGPTHPQDTHTASKPNNQQERGGQILVMQQAGSQQHVCAWQGRVACTLMSPHHDAAALVLPQHTLLHVPVARTATTLPKTSTMCCLVRGLLGPTRPKTHTTQGNTDKELNQVCWISNGASLCDRVAPGRLALHCSSRLQLLAAHCSPHQHCQLGTRAQPLQETVRKRVKSKHRQRPTPPSQTQSNSVKHRSQANANNAHQRDSMPCTPGRKMQRRVDGRARSTFQQPGLQRQLHTTNQQVGFTVTRASTGSSPGGPAAT